MTTKITTTPTPLAVVDIINSIIDDTTNLSTTVGNKLDKTGTAAKATADASGNNIADTYVTKSQAVTSLSASGKTVTYTKADGSTGTFTTQDTTGGYHTGNATSIGGASTTKPAVVVTTYRSGKTWYRKWSDGWLEQGGQVIGDKDTKITVTFPKAFSTTDYTVFGHRNYADSSHVYAVMVATGTTTKCYLRNSGIGGDSYPMQWHACGY